LLTWQNWKGIQASARFLKGTTFVFLAFVLVFALAGAKHRAFQPFAAIQPRASRIGSPGLAGGSVDHGRVRIGGEVRLRSHA